MTPHAPRPTMVEPPLAPRSMTRAEYVAHVTAVVAKAPPLTDEQRARITALLRTGARR